jgi:hypothetical protein
MNRVFFAVLLSYEPTRIISLQHKKTLFIGKSVQAKRMSAFRSPKTLEQKVFQELIFAAA